MNATKEKFQKAKENQRAATLKNPVYQGYGIGGVVILGVTYLLAPSTASASALIGLFALVATLLGILYLDIRRYKTPLTADPGKLTLLGLILLGTLAADRFVAFLLQTFIVRFPDIDPASILFALPTAAGAMLTTLLLDTHMGLIVAFVLSLLTGMTMSEEPFLTVYSVVGSIVAVFGVIYCRRRTHLLRAGLMVGISNILMIGALHLYEAGGIGAHFLTEAAFGLGGGLAVALIVSGVLPLLESLFAVTTDIRLLELLDLNQPLLRQLSVNAPGTYYHSMMVSNLAEAAAVAVGENSLHVRVCCYYHDIGKMLRPEYYIENQMGVTNLHDQLHPHLSSLILIAHVKEGVELARKEGLPQFIIDIIPQHHGTRLINYFYTKAKKVQDPSITPVTEEEFRYPGPKPQTKVAGIIMLADAVEASSRALPHPTPQRIASLVEKIVTHIYLDGQLDESDLTLKDLKKIKESLNKVLGRQFHRRIEYPGMGLSEHEEAQDGSLDRESTARVPAGRTLKGLSPKNPPKTGTA
jgi:putative nucleotidyltransferase with HDIG domain